MKSSIPSEILPPWYALGAYFLYFFEFLICCPLWRGQTTDRPTTQLHVKSVRKEPRRELAQSKEIEKAIRKELKKPLTQVSQLIRPE